MNPDSREPGQPDPDELLKDEKADRPTEVVDRPKFEVPETPVYAPLERRKTEQELEAIREQLADTPVERVIAYQPDVVTPPDIETLGETGTTRESIPAFAKEGQKLYHFLYQAMQRSGDRPLERSDVVRILSELEANVSERISILEKDSEPEVDKEYASFLNRVLGEVRIVLKQAEEKVVDPKYEGDWFLREALFRLEVEGLIPGEVDDKIFDHPDKAAKLLKNSPYLDEETKNQLVSAYRAGKLKALAWASPLVAGTGFSATATGYLAYAASILELGTPAWVTVGVAGGIITPLVAWSAKIVYDSHKYGNLRNAAIKVLGNVREKTWQKWFPKEPKPQVENILKSKE
jgi:hypothetical protein